MKFVIVLCLWVATASAGTLPGLMQRWPMVPVFTLNELKNRITGGEVATPGQFPWQAALSIKFGPNSYGFCGGSLINDHQVLTAAHCMDGALKVDVILGAFNITDPNEQGRQIFGNKTIRIHSGWNRNTLENDIALIELSHRVEFNVRIHAIDLPENTGKQPTYAWKKALISGWGKDSDAATTVSPVLRFAEVDVITNLKCNTRYLGLVKPEMICISGRGGKSTCNGDSGGPLAYYNGTNWILIGATSFGIYFGCEVGWPAVFTRVTSYVDWIEQGCDVVNN